MPSLDAAGSLFFVFLFGGPVLAVLALVSAHRHNHANLWDYGVLVAPTFMFFVVGCQREELRTGWALLLWPVLIECASTYLVAGKLLIVNRVAPNTTRSSKILFVASMAAAVGGALAVPQLLE